MNVVKNRNKLNNILYRFVVVYMIPFPYLTQFVNCDKYNGLNLFVIEEKEDKEAQTGAGIVFTAK